MASIFATKKAKILLRLDLPDAEYQDASPKGSVDENIQDLISDIKDLDGFVTTSSCGGRIAVYCDGPPKSGVGGKGGGKWLFTSHQQLDADALGEDGVLFALLGFPREGNVSAPSAAATVGATSFVHFKFEPMILHILTSSLAHAQQALTAAMDAGFRESGISGINPSGNKPVMPMVAVRTTGLAFDCIVGFQECSDSGQGEIVPMVSETYLRTLIQVSNERFKSNELRKERFRQALLARTADGALETG